MPFVQYKYCVFASAWIGYKKKYKKYSWPGARVSCYIMRGYVMPVVVPVAVGPVWLNNCIYDTLFSFLIFFTGVYKMVEEKSREIRPHALFTVFSADHVAESFGVDRDLYRKLWGLHKTGWHYGLSSSVSLARYGWRRLSRKDQVALNKLAARQEADLDRFPGSDLDPKGQWEIISHFYHARKSTRGKSFKKVHLKKTVGKVSGMACSNLYNNREYGPLSKGRIVELQKFLETQKENRCMKCQKIASKFSSYV
jgi:hypothetical protein